jgi:endo-1,4-beta-mannosidase
MAAIPERFRLGVNYWPSDTAMEWLPRYDPVTVRRDFTTIAASGMDTVRIFLRWEDLQPTPTAVDTTALDAVVDVADAAAATGVELIVTLFTGHMSGVNWIPGWATGGSDGDDRFRVVTGGTAQPHRRCLRNWYADADIIDAQLLLARAVAAALSGHPALWAWDLGNENSNCVIPRSANDADRWLEQLTSALRDQDPEVLITIGTHMEDLETDRLISPAEAARWCDFMCMHGYPVYADWSGGPTDTRFVPFLAEMTMWLANDTPVLFAELGQSTVARRQPSTALQVSEDDAAAYTGDVLDRLHDQGVIGALLWCFADYTTELHASPPFDLATHERSFGVWRADGTQKPAVAEITARANRMSAPMARARPWLDVTVDEFTADRRHHLVRLYERYRQTKERS